MARRTQEDMKMVTLFNVMDIRTGNVYTVAKVKASKARWFIPA